MAFSPAHNWSVRVYIHQLWHLGDLLLIFTAPVRSVNDGTSGDHMGLRTFARRRSRTTARHDVTDDSHSAHMGRCLPALPTASRRHRYIWCCAVSGRVPTHMHGCVVDCGLWMCGRTDGGTARCCGFSSAAQMRALAFRVPQAGHRSGPPPPSPRGDAHSIHSVCCPAWCAPRRPSLAAPEHYSPAQHTNTREWGWWRPSLQCVASAPLSTPPPCTVYSTRLVGMAWHGMRGCCFPGMIRVGTGEYHCLLTSRDPIRPITLYNQLCTLQFSCLRRSVCRGCWFSCMGGWRWGGTRFGARRQCVRSSSLVWLPVYCAWPVVLWCGHMCGGGGTPPSRW